MLPCFWGKVFEPVSVFARKASKKGREKGKAWEALEFVKVDSARILGGAAVSIKFAVFGVAVLGGLTDRSYELSGG